jgi:hypothetical protein
MTIRHFGLQASLLLANPYGIGAEHLPQVWLFAATYFRSSSDGRARAHQVRKATLASVLAKAAPGVWLNEHIEADGPTVFAHACRMGLEGIVSKRKASSYRSGRSPDWLKSKNPAWPCSARRKNTGAADAAPVRPAPPLGQHSARSWEWGRHGRFRRKLPPSQTWFGVSD